MMIFGKCVFQCGDRQLKNGSNWQFNMLMGIHLRKIKGHNNDLFIKARIKINPIKNEKIALFHSVVVNRRHLMRHGDCGDQILRHRPTKHHGGGKNPSLNVFPLKFMIHVSAVEGNRLIDLQNLQRGR